MKRAMICLRALGLAGALSCLAGCNWAVLDPGGPVGRDELGIITLSTWLMLLIVAPVIVLTLFFAWRYRASNVRARYAPDWERSLGIAAVMVLAPCAIIAVLGTVAWQSSHRLDPFQALQSPRKPLVIDVVAMDWKWLFVYPEQHIATINQVKFPVGTPVEFRITATSVMNSFFIPQLGGQIYAMPGMQTQLHLMADRAGAYDGMSANYSGEGFSDMKFKAVATSQPAFDAWVAAARQGGGERLSLARYASLAQPSLRNPVAVFADVDPRVYDSALRQYQVQTTRVATTDGLCAHPED